LEVVIDDESSRGMATYLCKVVGKIYTPQGYAMEGALQNLIGREAKWKPLACELGMLEELIRLTISQRGVQSGGTKVDKTRFIKYEREFISYMEKNIRDCPLGGAVRRLASSNRDDFYEFDPKSAFDRPRHTQPPAAQMAPKISVNIGSQLQDVMGQIARGQANQDQLMKMLLERHGGGYGEADLGKGNFGKVWSLKQCGGGQGGNNWNQQGAQGHFNEWGMQVGTNGKGNWGQFQEQPVKDQRKGQPQYGQGYGEKKDWGIGAETCERGPYMCQRGAVYAAYGKEGAGDDRNNVPEDWKQGGEKKWGGGGGNGWQKYVVEDRDKVPPYPWCFNQGIIKDTNFDLCRVRDEYGRMNWELRNKEGGVVRKNDKCEPDCVAHVLGVLVGEPCCLRGKLCNFSHTNYSQERLEEIREGLEGYCKSCGGIEGEADAQRTLIFVDIQNSPDVERHPWGQYGGLTKDQLMEMVRREWNEDMGGPKLNEIDWKQKVLGPCPPKRGANLLPEGEKQPEFRRQDWEDILKWNWPKGDLKTSYKLKQNDKDQGGNDDGQGGQGGQGGPGGYGQGGHGGAAQGGNWNQKGGGQGANNWNQRGQAAQGGNWNNKAQGGGAPKNDWNQGNKNNQNPLAAGPDGQNPNAQGGGNWNPNAQGGGNWNPNAQGGGNWNPKGQGGGNWNANRQQNQQGQGQGYGGGAPGAGKEKGNGMFQQGGAYPIQGQDDDVYEGAFLGGKGKGAELFRMPPC
jgi:hypothetical protein